MGKAPCCDKSKVKKGPWSPEEDIKLKEFIEKNGTGGNWIALPQKAGLKRCGKSCRLRWLNYLRPNIKHGDFTDDEDRVICTLFATIGSRWSIIAAQLPGRTDNDIKNYWNTKLKKKLLGIPPAPRKSNQQQMKHQNHNHQQLFQSSLDHNINVNITPPTTTSYSSFGTLESTQILPPLLHTNELPYSYQLGFENNNYIDYCGFEGTHSLLIGSNGSSSDQEAPPLDLDGINYEELNQMVCLKNSNWCSGLNVEDPTSTNICFRNQERVMCSYNN